MNNISDRYKKALVTVAMGFRTEDEIRKNGLYIFPKSKKEKLLEYSKRLFKKNNQLLALKVQTHGYNSQHILIKSLSEFKEFINQIDKIFDEFCEIWIITSCGEYCWRCRAYFSLTNDEYIEMVYSDDDHILDHMNDINEEKYIRYSIKNNIILNKSLLIKEEDIEENKKILFDILIKYNKEIKKIKEDLLVLSINDLSLDIRVNNGYDFHDFDVSYDNTEKIIKYYNNIYLSKIKSKIV